MKTEAEEPKKDWRKSVKTQLSDTEEALFHVHGLVDQIDPFDFPDVYEALSDIEDKINRLTWDMEDWVKDRKLAYELPR